MENNKIKLSGYLIYLLGFTILLISFYSDIDGSYSPLSGDFRDTWPYVIKLKSNFMFDPSPWTLHFPLHYFFLSKLNFFFENPDDVRLIFCLISFITPYIFYLCLKNIYHGKKLNNLFILSSLILFTPSYIYSAVWANDNNLSYIFILIGVYFFYTSTRYQDINKNKRIHLYTSFLFFALACYSRQYYSVFYAYFLIFFIKKIDLKNYFMLMIYSGLLALPGLYFLYRYPSLYNNLAFSGNIFNTLLGNVVSISIYTFPIFFINVFFNNFYDIKIKKVYLSTLLSFLAFLLIYIGHNAEMMGQNGGIFFIASKLFFGNYLLFYLMFLINFTLILTIFDTKKDLFLIFSILTVISGIIVLQKYFEPLFFIFFFLFSQSKFKNLFLNNSKAALLLIVYHLIYYLTAVSDILYKISFI